MDPTLRSVTLSDGDALFELTQKFATSFTPERPAFEAAFRVLLDQDDAHLTGVSIDGVLVGYCLGFDHFAFYANGRVAWVEELMVDEAHRRQGLGRALMDDFEAWARSRSAKLCGLATRRAAAFYSAIGYDDSATFFRKMLS